MKLGIIGCGKMGTALVQGAIRGGVVKAENVTGVDVFAAARDNFVNVTGGNLADAAGDLRDCSVVLLCTKPHDAAAALGELAGSGTLVISVAAGVKLAALEAAAGEGARVIRAMPNTPALVGKGAAAFCAGGAVTEEDEKVASDLLGAVGEVVQVPERLMDAVTGLSGSGPAYVYLMIEALSDGGVKSGLPRADATKLAAQTVMGAASMVLETGLHPGELKDMVTSPGGTTITGVAELERRGLRSALIDAVVAAGKRSVELGQ